MTLEKAVTEAWQISADRKRGYGHKVRNDKQEGMMIVEPGKVTVFGVEYQCSSVEMAVELVKTLGLTHWSYSGSWKKFDVTQ